MKIVLADDEMIVRVGLKSILDWESHGHRIVADVSDGEQALEAIYRYHPDVVITDIRMPVMDGNALIREIAKLPPPRPKVIVLSSYSDFDLVKDAMAQGAVDYILKMRMEPQDLLAALGTAQAWMERPADSSATEEPQPGPSIAAVCRALRGEPLTAQERASIEGYCYHVCLLALKNPHILHADPAMLRRSIENVVQEILCQHDAGLCAQIEPTRYMAMLFCPTDGGIPGDIRLFCPQIGEKLDKYLNIKVAWSQAERGAGLDGLIAAYAACTDHFNRYAPTDSTPPKSMPRVIRDAILYTQQNYTQDITLARVAQNASMSTAYFSTLFHNETGSSFVDYLNHVRIERAKELLTDSSIRIYEIADRVGYQSSNYFNRVFKKLVGVTPVEYRNQ